MAHRERSRVVIVGGGFSGLWAARTLSRHPIDVWMVNRDNYHTFLPLTYQVAAAELEPEEIAYPLRTIMRRWSNLQFVMAEVTHVDFGSQTVHMDVGTIQYDYLILAMGSTEHFLGVPGAAEHTFALKNLKQAIDLRNHILCCFERATRTSSAELRRRALTFTIVGGGSTGVEFAGALAELVHSAFTQDYPMLDFKEVRIVILEAANNLLPEISESGRSYAMDRLSKMGIEVRLRSKVTCAEQDAVYLEDSTVLPTETVVWTAGVRGVPQAQKWDLPIVCSGRVGVQSSLQVPGYPNVFVTGDLAYIEQDGCPLPMTAPVAIQEGTAAADNILRMISGQGTLAFRYRDKGAMVTIGRNAAVARLGRRTFTGFPAWLVWLGVHIFNLIGFRNRLFVLINWARDYFIFERAVKLILPLEPGACIPGRGGS